MPADGFRRPLHLVGRFVELVPLEPSHAAALAERLQDSETLRFFRSPPLRTTKAVAEWIQILTAAQRAGTDLPFTTLLKASREPIGMTRYLRIDRGTPSVEVGGTWLDPRFWGSPLNLETKWLLLRHAFEEEGVHRVQLQTDLRNLRSQRAVEGIGATFEARLREDVVLPDGTFRTSVYYSILESEWPQVRAGLEAKLARPWIPVVRPPPSTLRAASNVAEGPKAPPGDSFPAPLRFRPPVSLRGRHLRLVPLERSHVPRLAEAGADPNIWTLVRIRHGDTPEGMAGLVEDLLRLQEEGNVLAFTVETEPDHRPSGIARFLDIDRENRWVEVGTWIDSKLWRTPMNTEIKALLFAYAFEKEGVHRVQLKTDDRNVRSQAAIERLGAHAEGRMREHYRFPTGQYRTSLYYSILASEWPGVRARLASLLARPWNGPTRVTSS
ncbi:MAG: GNAT family N-acetyltransferase [Thermoplasmata archaeon]|nr:GNAT family N-acetyltransferase [Thermoplasmata archaeon]